MKKSSDHHQRKLLQKLLRQLRRESGLLQTTIAERLDRPQSFVSKYESGERRLDLIELRQVCDAMGITLDSFIIRFEGMSNESKSEIS